MATATSLRRLDLRQIHERDRFRLLQLAHRDAVIIVDCDYVVRHASDAAARLLGERAGAELEGETLLALVHGKDMMNLRGMVDRLASRRAPTVDGVSRLRAGDQWDWFRLRAARFSHGSGSEDVVAIFFTPLRLG